jgi:hypothetical protein
MLGLKLAIAGGVSNATIARADPDDLCARVGNDDRVRPYEPSLRPDFVRAYKRLFPTARGGLSDTRLRARAFFRCMDGKLVACFAEATLPCGPINQSRFSAAADAFCRDLMQARDVPREVSGFDSQFLFHCVEGRAEVSGSVWVLDRRGFAKDLWTPLDLD